MGSFYYHDQNSFRFSFHIKIWSSQRGLNNKSPNLHKKAKTRRILVVVVVKWRHPANGLFDNTKHLIFGSENIKQLNFRHFNTNSEKKITVTVIFFQEDTKISPIRQMLSCLVYQGLEAIFWQFPKTTQDFREGIKKPF